MPHLSATDQREDTIQAAIVDYLRAVVPSAVVSSIPLGGLRSKREAAKLKWTGALAGIPDLVAALPGAVTLWIEVKRPKAGLTDRQPAIHEALAALGHHVIVAREIADVRTALADLGVATREAASLSPSES